jgi:hypothetical protein
VATAPLSRSDSPHGPLQVLALVSGLGLVLESGLVAALTLVSTLGSG